MYMAPSTLSAAAATAPSSGRSPLCASCGVARWVCPGVPVSGPSLRLCRRRLRASLSCHHRCRCPCRLRCAALLHLARACSSRRLSRLLPRSCAPSRAASLPWRLISSSVAMKPVRLMIAVLCCAVFTTGALVSASTVKRAAVLGTGVYSPFNSPTFVIPHGALGPEPPTLPLLTNLASVHLPRGPRHPTRTTLARA